MLLLLFFLISCLFRVRGESGILRAYPQGWRAGGGGVKELSVFSGHIIEEAEDEGGGGRRGRGGLGTSQRLLGKANSRPIADVTLSTFNQHFLN